MNEDSATAERWLPVVGWEGLYEVSDHGRVRSIDRREQCGTMVRRRAGRVLKVQDANDPDGSWRPSVILNREGRSRSSRVHALVAAAFIGPRPEGLLVRHLDDDPFNNRADNLAYGTKADNYADAVRNGLLPGSSEKCGRGHGMVAPNLTRRGDCKACSRMRVALRRVHGHAKMSDDPQVVSDMYFSDIMNGTRLYRRLERA